MDRELYSKAFISPMKHFHVPEEYIAPINDFLNQKIDNKIELFEQSIQDNLSS